MDNKDFYFYWDFFNNSLIFQQLIFSFLILFLFFFLKWKGVFRIPYPLFLFSFFGILYTLCTEVLFIPPSAPYFLINRIPGDYLNIQQSIIKRKIISSPVYIASKNFPVAAAHYSFTSESIEKLMEDNKNLAGVLSFSSDKSITLFSRNKQPVALGTFQLPGSYNSFKAYRLLESVSSVRFRYNKPVKEEDLSNLIRLMRQLFPNAPSNQENPEVYKLILHKTESDEENHELNAFLHFKMGNLLFIEYLKGKLYSPSYLKCARKIYQRGIRNLSKHHNLELKKALFNNMALATFLDFSNSSKEAAMLFRMGLMLKSNKKNTSLGLNKNVQLVDKNLRHNLARIIR